MSHIYLVGSQKQDNRKPCWAVYRVRGDGSVTGFDYHINSLPVAICRAKFWNNRIDPHDQLCEPFLNRAVRQFSVLNPKGN